MFFSFFILFILTCCTLIFLPVEPLVEIAEVMIFTIGIPGYAAACSAAGEKAGASTAYERERVPSCTGWKPSIFYASTQTGKQLKTLSDDLLKEPLEAEKEAVQAENKAVGGNRSGGGAAQQTSIGPGISFG